MRDSARAQPSRDYPRIRPCPDCEQEIPWSHSRGYRDHDCATLWLHCDDGHKRRHIHQKIDAYDRVHYQCHDCPRSLTLKPDVWQAFSASVRSAGVKDISLALAEKYIRAAKRTQVDL